MAPCIQCCGAADDIFVDPGAASIFGASTTVFIIIIQVLPHVKHRILYCIDFFTTVFYKISALHVPNPSTIAPDLPTHDFHVAVLSAASLVANLFTAATLFTGLNGSFQLVYGHSWVLQIMASLPIGPSLQFYVCIMAMMVLAVPNIDILVRYYMSVEDFSLSRITSSSISEVQYFLEDDFELEQTVQMDAIVQIITAPLVYLYCGHILPIGCRAVGQTYQQNISFTADWIAFVSPPLAGAMLFYWAGKRRHYQGPSVMEVHEKSIPISQVTVSSNGLDEKTQPTLDSRV